MTRLKSKIDSVYLEIVLNLTQDRCTVCVERTIGLDIVWDTPDGTMGVIWNLSSFHLEIVLVSVQDRCTVCAKLTIGSENHFGRTKWYS